VVELRWGPRGPGPPERPGGPRETSVLRGFKGACKRPLEIARFQSSDGTPLHPAACVLRMTCCNDELMGDRQMISSDDQTRNHFHMILCAGLQLHNVNKI